MRRVLISDCAQGELDTSYDWWAEHRSMEQAHRWYDGFVRAMLGLENHAERYSLAPESDLFRYEVRQLN